MTLILNEPLIRKVVEYIESNPEEWEQTNYGVDRSNVDNRWYRCGTTACFAGLTLLLSDAQSTLNNQHAEARDLLGLTVDQAFDLFEWYEDADYDNPTDKLKALKQNITEVTGLEFD